MTELEFGGSEELALLVFEGRASDTKGRVSAKVLKQKHKWNTPVCVKQLEHVYMCYDTGEPKGEKSGILE